MKKVRIVKNQHFLSFGVLSMFPGSSLVLLGLLSDGDREGTTEKNLNKSTFLTKLTTYLFTQLSALINFFLKNTPIPYTK